MSAESQKDAFTGLFDPFEPFRRMRDAYLDMAGKTMIDFVNSEQYAQATGMFLDASLSMAGPFRAAVEKTMTQTLAQLSMPSRQEVASLAERCTHIEMKLDDLDAKLDEIAQLLSDEKRNSRVA